MWLNFLFIASFYSILHYQCGNNLYLVNARKLQPVTCSTCSTLAALHTALCAISIDWFHLYMFAWDCPPTGWIFLVWWKCFLGDVPFSSGTSSCHKVKHLENVADISFQGVMAVVQMMAFWVCIPCPGTWFVVKFLWDVTNQIYYICENPKHSHDLHMADVQ